MQNQENSNSDPIEIKKFSKKHVLKKKILVFLNYVDNHKPDRAKKKFS